MSSHGNHIAAHMMPVCPQDINKANGYLKILNGKTATAVALILFNVGTATLNGE